ncbi:MAG: hypothetical protein K2X29_00900 [Candidatus Obscuribacterales bacterium]|nr:hypothetical protein [Candidatus Obscuribacterales bacterium]
MGHDSHGHDGHGHGGHAVAGIIPEDSVQDKMLILIAFLVLIMMSASGIMWSLSVGTTPPEMPAETESEHHAE